jgi:hypothetical protein
MTCSHCHSVRAWHETQEWVNKLKHDSLLAYGRGLVLLPEDLSAELHWLDQLVAWHLRPQLHQLGHLQAFPRPVSAIGIAMVMSPAYRAPSYEK